jgi:hypothetical protein
MLLPVARQENLVVRELPGETLVYDLKQNKAHCLNHSAAVVWRHCDGQTTLTELAAALRRELGVPDVEAAVRLALEQLSRRGLLEQPLPPLAEDQRRSRRDALRKLTAVLGAVPLVLSLSARHASAAVSLKVLSPNTPCTPPGLPCMTGLMNGSGVCTPIAQVANGTACVTSAGLPGTCTNGNCVATAAVNSCTKVKDCSSFAALCPGNHAASCVGGLCICAAAQVCGKDSDCTTFMGTSCPSGTAKCVGPAGAMQCVCT